MRFFVFVFFFKSGQVSGISYGFVGAKSVLNRANGVAICVHQKIHIKMKISNISLNYSWIRIKRNCFAYFSCNSMWPKDFFLCFKTIPIHIHVVSWLIFFRKKLFILRHEKYWTNCIKPKNKTKIFFALENLMKKKQIMNQVHTQVYGIFHFWCNSQLYSQNGWECFADGCFRNQKLNGQENLKLIDI